MVLSSLPVAMNLRLWETSMQFTRPECPKKIEFTLPLALNSTTWVLFVAKIKCPFRGERTKPLMASL